MKNVSNKFWGFIPITTIAIILLIFSSIIIFKDKEELQSVSVKESSNNNIIPKPLSYEKGTGNFYLTKETSIYVNGNNEAETEELSRIAELLREKLKPSTGFDLNIINGKDSSKSGIYLTTIGGEEAQGNEGYKIITTSESVKIIAYKPEGVYRGIQNIEAAFATRY